MKCNSGRVTFGRRRNALLPAIRCADPQKGFTSVPLHASDRGGRESREQVPRAAGTSTNNGTPDRQFIPTQSFSFLRSIYFARTERSGFRRRTPGPPPFSAMNSMPAFSRAPRTSSRVRGYGSLTPRSKSAIVFVAVLLASERSDCDHPRRPRAPRHCSRLIDIFNVTLHFIG